MGIDVHTRLKHYVDQAISSHGVSAVPDTETDIEALQLEVTI